jgi:hypothetical protein
LEEGKGHDYANVCEGQITDREMFGKHVERLIERNGGNGVEVDLKPLFDELVRGLLLENAPRLLTSAVDT